MTLYGKPQPPIVPGPEAYRLEDTYVISQDVSAIQAEARVRGYLQAGSPDVATADTLHGALSWTGVMRAIEEAPQSHAESHNDGPPMPVWPIVAIIAGLALIGGAVAMAWLAPLWVAVAG